VVGSALVEAAGRGEDALVATISGLRAALVRDGRPGA
jgi:hypothetical protein